MTTGPRPPDSLACREIPDADYVHLEAVPVPPERRGAVPDDPADLARRVFDISSASGAVRMLFALRQRLVGLIGVQPAPRDVFAVTEVCGGEALISVHDRHLDFCAGVASIDDTVRVVTTVRLRGWRGRLYFGPVRLAHPFVVRAMIRSAIARD